MAEIDYSKRNDSGQYYLSINGLKDACGKTRELVEVEEFEAHIVAEWLNVKEEIRVEEVKLIDANTDKVVGFGIVPYAVILQPGDSLTVTFVRSIVIRPKGVYLGV